MQHTTPNLFSCHLSISSVRIWLNWPVDSPAQQPQLRPNHRQVPPTGYEAVVSDAVRDDDPEGSRPVYRYRAPARHEVAWKLASSAIRQSIYLERPHVIRMWVLP